MAVDPPDSRGKSHPWFERKIPSTGSAVNAFKLRCSLPRTDSGTFLKSGALGNFGSAAFALAALLDGALGSTVPVSMDQVQVPESFFLTW